MSLRGPSADSRAKVADRLTEGLREGDSAKAAQVGSELFAVANVVRDEPRLRRALTDVSMDGEAKSALAHALFDGKADEVSVDLLAIAAAQRWTATVDLPDTLEVLGVEALVRAADDAGTVADELFAVERLLEANAELRQAMADPARTTQDKQGLLRDLLENRLMAPTLRLVELAVTSQNRTIGLALAEYERIAAAVNGSRVATVRSARQLSEREETRLTAALRKQYSSAVHLNLVVDPELVGGLRVEIGDDVIDGTVAGRVDDARRRLAG
jgi:F-type H+-transporting ATPase subunit delta